MLLILACPDALLNCLPGFDISSKGVPSLATAPAESEGPWRRLSSIVIDRIWDPIISAFWGEDGKATTTKLVLSLGLVAAFTTSYLLNASDQDDDSDSPSKKLLAALGPSYPLAKASAFVIRLTMMLMLLTVCKKLLRPVK